MRALLPGLLSLILVAPLRSAPDGVRRFEYPQDNFSIAVPATWSEVEPSVLAAAEAAARQVVPGVPYFAFSHGFKAPATAGANYPWVAIATMEGTVDERIFEQPDWVHRAVDEITKKWVSAGSPMAKAQIEILSYDIRSHLLWFTSQSTFPVVGDLRTLSGTYFTNVGSLQVHCYSKASDFVNDQPVCKEIIELVVIDPKVALPAGPVRSSALDGLPGTDYQTLARRVEAGDFSVDFHALRLACMKSKQCEPRATKADLAAINRAGNDHQFDKIVEITERLIRQGFVNLEAHLDCAVAYEEMHDAAKSKFHRLVTRSLLGSILFSGDGKTKETAYQVIPTAKSIQPWLRRVFLTPVPAFQRLSSKRAATFTIGGRFWIRKLERRCWSTSIRTPSPARAGWAPIDGRTSGAQAPRGL